MSDHLLPIPSDNIVALFRAHEERHQEDRAEIERMRGLLRHAIDDIEHWGSYASEYFQKKWNLAGDLARYRTALGAADQPSDCSEDETQELRRLAHAADTILAGAGVLEIAEDGGTTAAVNNTLAAIRRLAVIAADQPEAVRPTPQELGEKHAAVLKALADNSTACQHHWIEVTEQQHWNKVFRCGYCHRTREEPR